MKKLYRKGTVHPSPSPSPPPSDQFSLSYLPAAVLTLAAALSADDKQVLAYLLSCSITTTPFDFDPSKSSSHKKHNNNNNSNNNNNVVHHAPSFTCYCFSCYTNYWARWDSSPNRQLIHEIIDAFEDGLLRKKKNGVNKKDKKKNNNNKNNKKIILNGVHNTNTCEGGVSVNNTSDRSVRGDTEVGRIESVGPDGRQGEFGDETGEKQGSVRKIVSFIGERIWGSVWG